VALSAAACAVPIDLHNCHSTAISPYLLAVLFVKSICGFFSGNQVHEGDVDINATGVKSLAVEFVKVFALSEEISRRSH
jgi:hypothetical protein